MSPAIASRPSPPHLATSVGILVVALHLLASSGFGRDLPTAPEGYHWEVCEDIDGALLRPEGWHFLRRSTGGTLAYFLTEESWEPPEDFDTGLTLNVIFDMPRQGSVLPSAFAKSFVDRARALQETKKTWSETTGPFHSEGIVYEGRGRLEGIRFFNLVIGNDASGTTYLLFVEAPVERWDSTWAKLETVVDRIVLDEAR